MPFTPNPQMLAAMTGVMRRIIESGRQPVFDLDHWQKARRFFAENPSEDTVYIYPSGFVLGLNRYTRIVRTRHTQVCLGQAHGWFPMAMSRHSTEFWQPAANTCG